MVDFYAKKLSKCAVFAFGTFFEREEKTCFFKIERTDGGVHKHADNGKQKDGEQKGYEFACEILEKAVGEYAQKGNRQHGKQ